VWFLATLPGLLLLQSSAVFKILRGEADQSKGQ
jgi:hypothetical protein